MKHKSSIYTLALLGALALAAVSGGLLTTSDNVVYAADPDFVDGTAVTRNVDENTPPGTNIGDPVTATDADEDDFEFGDTLTYTLEGTDAASFDIDGSTGQLITKAPLNADTDTGGKARYSVTVKVEDSSGGDDTVTVDILVEDILEASGGACPADGSVGRGHYEHR